MFWWLLWGCVTQRAVIPMGTQHIGPWTEPLRLPLLPVWVDSPERGCAPQVEALKFALQNHADQLVLPSADVRIELTACKTVLFEDVRVESQPEDSEVLLTALLTGEASVEVRISKHAFLLDVQSFRALRVEHQGWVGGGRYVWREDLSGRVQRDLIEKVENALVKPHPALRPPPPTSSVFTP